MPARRPLAERFWEKVDKSPESGCWHFTGCRNADGYGVIGIGETRPNGSPITDKAHRVAWYLTHGEWPDGHVLHSCDNPQCVNPDHLRLGTHAENMQEMWDKKRHGGSKLTEEMAAEIRRRRAAGEPVREVAAAYGVHYTTVSNITNNRRWNHA
jgi:hypothetical protein